MFKSTEQQTAHVSREHYHAVEDKIRTTACAKHEDERKHESLGAQVKCEDVWSLKVPFPVVEPSTAREDASKSTNRDLPKRIKSERVYNNTHFAHVL